MTPLSTLSYQGRPIRLRGTMLNLTDMWQAAGRPENRRPTDWLSLGETRRFRAYADTHWTEADDSLAANAGQTGIWHLDTDGLIATVRGNGGGTWAHWQLALAYARYLSPEFHLWCNTVVRAALAWTDERRAAEHDPLHRHLAQQFRTLHSRLDTLERHTADLMFLVLSAQEILLGKRLEFTPLTRSILTRAVAAEPFDGQCPCCLRERVLTGNRQPASGAAFDHFYHRGLNRPEHGWLICAACHDELTYGSYLVRFARVPEFRAFQAAVLEHRRRERAAPDDEAE